MKHAPSFAMTLAAIAISHTVAKADDAPPWFEGAVSVEVQNDAAFDSEAAGNERNDLYTTIEPEVTFRVAPGLSLFAHGTLEPMRDPDPGEDRVLEDHGIYLDELHVDYQKGGFALKGGKFTPAFGLAWDAAAGIYGSEFAEDYELSERIGAEASMAFGREDLGRHVLAVSAYFLDTSILAQSIGTSRGTRAKADGGVSNTEDLSSVSVSLTGGGLPGLGGFGYHLAYARQEEGRDGTAAENAVVGTLHHEGIEIAPELVFVPLVEVAGFRDADGENGKSRSFVTASGQLNWRSWNLAAAVARRRTEAAGASAVADDLVQLSAGYTFEFGLSADVGWRRTHVEGISTHTAGVLLGYNYTF